VAPGGAKPLRWLLPILPALAAVALVEVGSARRGLAPFTTSGARRGAMGLLLALVFYLGVFAPVAWAGRMPRIDLEALGAADLFFLHGVLVASLLAWFQLGYGGGAESPLQALARTCGLQPPSFRNPSFRDLSSTESESATRGILREVGAGLLVGPFLWMGVLLAVGAVALLVRFLGFEESLPQAAPELVTFMASLPLLLRLALSLSAGVVEEVFFRGFLQKRIGIGMSTLFFVLAHLTYEAPLMLVGVTLLSLLFAGLTVMRGNVWPAVAAHTLFDAIQLLWVVPAAVRAQEGGVLGLLTAISGWIPELIPGPIW